MAGLTKAQRAIKKEAIALSGLDEAAFAALPEAERQVFLDRAAAETDIGDKINSEPDDEPEDDGLLEVHKAGEVLRVHPTCLLAHIDAGWQPK